MGLFNHILYYVFYPIELILRFFFPYAFKDDPYNPEPQNKEERKARRIQKKQDRRDQKRPVTERRENFNERKKVKENPDYEPVAKSAQYIAPTKSKDNKDVISEETMQKLTNLKQKSQKAKKELGINMIDLESGLTNDSAFELMKEAEPKTAFYWHNTTLHQVAVKFEKGGLKDEYKTRDNAERQKLEPLIEPKRKANRDRTHVIPIGYHGSESDKRLLVGFSSKLNQQDLKNFEDKAGILNKKYTILWFVDIRKQEDNSVIWYATVWNDKGDKLLQDSFHDKQPFIWKSKRF